MPHEEQREKNIRLVTEKALDCFLEIGIEKTKIADIARQCGLTERSVFRYFETKADLVLAASLLCPKILRPSSRKRSAIPAARAASGPTTVRSMRFSFAKFSNASTSVSLILTHSAIVAMPAFPGAQ